MARCSPVSGRPSRPARWPCSRKLREPLLRSLTGKRSPSARIAKAACKARLHSHQGDAFRPWPSLAEGLPSSRSRTALRMRQSEIDRSPLVCQLTDAAPDRRRKSSPQCPVRKTLSATIRKGSDPWRPDRKLAGKMSSWSATGHCALPTSGMRATSEGICVQDAEPNKSLCLFAGQFIVRHCPVLGMVSSSRTREAVHGCPAWSDQP